MKIGITTACEDINYNNYIFSDELYNKSFCSAGYRPSYVLNLLKSEIEKNGHSFDTLDMHRIDQYKKIFCINVPSKDSFNKFYQMSKHGTEFYLYLIEPESVYERNWDKKNHFLFKKIFTWNDDLVDGQKYIKIQIPNAIPEDFPWWSTKKKSKLLTMVSGNKTSLHPQELYSERMNCIRWFEENHPHDFEFYGNQWDKYCFKGRLISKLNRFEFLRKMLKKKYPSYRGKILDKLGTISNYNFAIAYENIKDIKGYITEKIFDCFYAGCVPIYWGAPNIKDYIPSNLYIDKRNFNNYQELYSYLKGMSEVEYLHKIEDIKNYVKGDTIKMFSAETFVSTLIEQMSIKHVKENK